MPQGWLMETVWKSIWQAWLHSAKDVNQGGLPTALADS